MWIAFFKLMISLTVLLFLIYYGYSHLQKTFKIPVHRSRMKVIDQVKVSPKVTLSVVKIESNYLLIGSSDQQCTLLKELDPMTYETSDSDETNHIQSVSFHSMFSKKNEEEKKREKQN